MFDEKVERDEKDEIGEYYGQDYIDGALVYQSAAVSVMDARTGFVLYENAQHELLYPASVTKIMTALLVIEEVEDLSETVLFSDYAVLSLPYYASRMNVAVGDSMTVYEALYGLMLPSGNDVANALAEHVSGDIAAFVSRMNRRAEELGAYNTRFINACGLPGYNQHTTAYDMALIMREAISHPLFNRIIASPYFTVSPMESMPYGLPMRNTNRMIRPTEEYYNPAIVGGKTGFTNAAQHTLVSYARQGEHQLIVSVLYAPSRATFTDTTALLNYAFAMPVETIFTAANYNWEVPVIQDIEGEPSQIASLRVEAQGNLRIPIPEDMPTIRREIYIPESVRPPVREGDVVGSKRFYAGDTLISEVNLISAETVLPRIVAPRTRPESLTMIPPEPIFSFSPFFAIMPLLTLMFMGIILVLLRRHRRLLRRRRMARVRYARYTSYE